MAFSAVVIVVVVDVVVVVVVDARLFGTCVRKLFGPRRNKMPKVLLIDFFHEKKKKKKMPQP